MSETMEAGVRLLEAIATLWIYGYVVWVVLLPLVIIISVWKLSQIPRELREIKTLLKEKEEIEEEEEEEGVRDGFKYPV